MRHFLSAETATLFVKHRVSKLVHLRDGERGKPCKTLSCGRTLNGNYQTVSEFGTFDLCKRCRINAEKDGIFEAGLRAVSKARKRVELSWAATDEELLRFTW